MAKVKVKELEIAYNLRGEGDTLVLICGFTMTKEMWGPLVSGLTRHFQVLTIDNRGVGETLYPAGGFSIADMAGDTVGLFDALGIKKANVFGVSMGGLITQTLVLDYPDRISKAALGCTSHGGRHAVQPDPAVMVTLASAADPNITPEESVRKFIPVLYSERFIQERPDRLEEFIKVSQRYLPTPEGAAAQMQALSIFNVKRRLGEIRHPILVITGDEDRMMPPENSRLLAGAVAGAKLCMIEGAGHSFFHEKPEEVCRILIEFFGRP